MGSVRAPPVVNFITGNANKLSEVKAILEPAIRVDSQAIDIEEIQGSIEEVTEAKCRKAADVVMSPTSRACSTAHRPLGRVPRELSPLMQPR